MSIYGPNYEAYLAALKPDSYILVGSRRQPRVEKVSKITTTQIVTARTSSSLSDTKPNENRYSKQTGAERGGSGYYYSRNYILPDVPTIQQTAEFEQSEKNQLAWRAAMLDIIKYETELAQHIALKLGISVDRVKLSNTATDRFQKAGPYNISIEKLTPSEIEGTKESLDKS